MGKSPSIHKPRKATATDRTLGRTLRSLRLRAGLPLDDVAWQLGITYQQLQKYESGQSRVSVSYLVHLRRIYGVSYDMLLDGLDPAQSAMATTAPLPEDRVSADIFRKIAALPDITLKRKINRIVDILSS